MRDMDRAVLTFKATGKRAGVLNVKMPGGETRSVPMVLEEVKISGQSRRTVSYTGGKPVWVTTVPTTKNEWNYKEPITEGLQDFMDLVDAASHVNRMTGAGAVRGGGFVPEGEKVPTNAMGEVVKGKTYKTVASLPDDDDGDTWRPLAVRRSEAKAKYAERAKKHNVKGKDSPQQDLDTIAMVAEIRGKGKVKPTMPLDRISEAQTRMQRMTDLKKLLESRVYSNSIALDSRGNKKIKTDTTHWEQRNALIKRIASLDRGINRQRVLIDKMRNDIRSGPDPATANTSPKLSAIDQARRQYGRMVKLEEIIYTRRLKLEKGPNESRDHFMSVFAALNRKEKALQSGKERLRTKINKMTADKSPPWSEQRKEFSPEARPSGNYTMPPSPPLLSTAGTKLVVSDIDKRIFKPSVPEPIQKDGQKIISAVIKGDLPAIEKLNEKYEKFAMQSQGGGGSGPGKVKKVDPAKAFLGSITSDIVEKTKPSGRNWTPGNIFDVRGKIVVDRVGKSHTVELLASGWKIDNTSGMDVWAACHMLNDMQASIPSTTPTPPKPKRDSAAQARRREELRSVLIKRLQNVERIGWGTPEQTRKEADAIRKRINSLNRAGQKKVPKFDEVAHAKGVIAAKSLAGSGAVGPAPKHVKDAEKTLRKAGEISSEYRIPHGELKPFERIYANKTPVVGDTFYQDDTVARIIKISKNSLGNTAVDYEVIGKKSGRVRTFYPDKWKREAASPKRVSPPTPKKPTPKKASPRKAAPKRAANMVSALTAHIKKIGVDAKVEVHAYPKGAAAKYSYEIVMRKKDKSVESKIDEFYDAEKSVPRDGVLRFRVGGV
jgi:hypothetical protein